MMIPRKVELMLRIRGIVIPCELVIQSEPKFYLFDLTALNRFNSILHREIKYFEAVLQVVIKTGFYRCPSQDYQSW